MVYEQLHNPTYSLNAWLWWSSGKDSAWALHTLRRGGDVHVERLITTVTSRFSRVAIHGTRLSVLNRQAESAGCPLEVIELPYPCTNTQYETAIAPVLSRAKEKGLDAMVFGDLLLEDVRDYKFRLLENTGIEALFPLWDEDTARLARTMIDTGVEAYITALDPKRMDPRYAGTLFSHEFLNSLPDAVDPCGENGEFHTCVVAGPMLERWLSVKELYIPML